MSWRDRAYAALPEWGQHLAVTAQGWLHRRTRYSAVFDQALDELAALEYAPARQLEAEANRRLRELLRHAYKTVPYYRQQARLPWWRVTGAAGLPALPITSKAALRAAPGGFLSSAFEGLNLIPWHTSGTSGTPVTLFYDPSAVARQYAFIELYRLGAGVSRHERRGQFTGRLIAPAGSRTFWRHDYTNRALLLSSVHLHNDHLPAYVQALRNFAPACLSGYPSAIYLLARHLVATGSRLPLKAVLTSAETLLAHQRASMEEAFSTHVYDQYGQTEMQSFWFECSHGRMHAHPLAGVTELLRPDGEPAAPGEWGHVVLTGLLNRAMPLIRYEVGDLARWSGEPCPCGRQMPVIAEIAGRFDDYVWTEERGWVGRLDPVFKGLRNLIETQIIQDHPQRLRVRYVADPAFTTRDLLNLEASLRGRVGDRVQLDFEACTGIPRGPNGKFRAVVSELGPEYRLAGR
ncbi:MAG: phenylacetate--CoA ligase family protein [Acidobacteria bacterium]|nr:phenylacetate--CoA ligase family protein [Acidobacteriota bacterium]